MAGTFEEPLFFSSAMITTSSRLQHLDSHFSLHARLSSCRQATAKPQVDLTHSSPAPHLSPPIQNINRSPSRVSNSSDTASFYTAHLNREDVHGRAEETPCRLNYKQGAVIGPQDAQHAQTVTNEAKVLKDTDTTPTPQVANIPVIEPLKELPERSSVISRRESIHRQLYRRRTSAISEPLPRPAIPRRTSSTVHRRQRKGQDLISFHRDSCRLFQSLEGTLLFANCEVTRPNFTKHHSMPSSLSRSLDQPLELPVIEKAPKPLEANLERQPRAESRGGIPEHMASTISLPVSVEIDDTVPPIGPTAATVVCWTTAETRKREYEKIDQAYSGLRGLWKKLTPKWCHGRNSRRKFFEGKCDGDSVRRYRMEMPTR